MIRRNWGLASSMPGAARRRAISPCLPALDVAAAAADALDHRLAGVGRLEGALERALDPQPGERERLAHALAQRARGAGVGALELGGERLQALERAPVVVVGPGGAEPALDGGPVALGQVLEHVA